ncbi:hypothetical protein V5O48_011062 [Marasmius crinis-equi]|uniref:F-box domain-containing protein n=1 Tax=Marasmius crinis-equi TaxID=585013 RepID=A0ABR3F6Z6_9AGAR
MIDSAIGRELRESDETHDAVFSLPTPDSPSSLYACQSCGIRIGQEKAGLSVLPASLEDLLSSNEPPSTTGLQDSEIRPIFARQSQEIAQSVSFFNTRISRLKSSLEALTRQRDVLEIRLQRCGAVFHSIRRLPDDVLEQIFRFCVDRDVRGLLSEYPGSLMLDIQDHRGTLDTRKAPWVLGQVCRKWRACSTSLPTLWTSIRLDGDALSSNEETMGLLSRQLDYCAGQPLSVTYYQYPRRNSSPSLLSILLSKSYQWSLARINLDPRQLDDFAPGESIFMNLRELHLYFRGHSSMSDEYTYLTHFFRDATKLHKLFLHGLGVISNIAFLGFPWARITHYECRETPFAPGCNDSLHYHVLRHMSRSVTIARINCARFHALDPRTLSGDYLVLPALHTFELRLFDIHRGPGSLLQWITTPSLRSLTLRDLTIDSLELIIEFLERSSCSLVEFGLVDMNTEMKGHEITRLLRVDGMNGVRTLSLGYGRDQRKRNYSDSGSPWDARTDDGKIFLPVLQTLILCTSNLRWAYVVLHDLFTRRRKLSAAEPVPRLDCLVVRRTDTHEDLALELDVAGEGIRSIFGDVDGLLELQYLCEEENVVLEIQ